MGERIVWDNNLIKTKLLEVVNSRKLNHFPTHNEITEYFGNRALTNKISKTGGTVYWAELLGLPLKESETTMGNFYEIKSIEDIYVNTGLVGVRMTSRFPYDVYVSHGVKVDVKVASPFKNNCNAYANSFNLEKKYPTCDIYILYCLDLNKEIDKTLIVPSCRLVGQKQIGVGKNSQYNIYIDRWDILSEYDSFFKRYC